MAVVCECGKIVKNENMMRHHKKGCANILSVREAHSNQMRDKKMRKEANAASEVQMRII